ncbi:DNA topoisomerase 2-binding protein 1 [Solanum tuberosum]|uniref:DNA topoisomerase 2-binding protein 1 n=1 Tax=Solanum tuberosum TaxID=4113 RepID=UPI0003D25E6F|nr:PREDICTED: DNA topoisomerase 2-binding protein 1 [Solanum tuberosum]
MMTTKVFNGANAFMSRNLVPPEQFDALHDALKLNGAQVLLCCDPSRNAPTDYHVISSPQHEKFGDLQAKGCNLIGPQCILSCAKEQRPLPQQGFTCCLAMDGVKILASGFEMDEKVEIGKLVIAMGGVLQTKASLDVSFVIVKNVLAAKYKWAYNILKKPIVTINWLHQCWKEHRLVPQESFKILPFSGLTISVTRVPADERKDMEKIILQNGGKYSPELTRKCSHLICDVPEGDKFKVAKRWGCIHTVTKRWFEQSVARRACLNEESYPVQAGSNTLSTVRMTNQHSLEKGIRNLQGLSSLATASSAEPVFCSRVADSDLEATLSQNMSATSSYAPVFTKEPENSPAEYPKSDYSAPVSTKGKKSGASTEQENNGCDGVVADDSETDDNDLYLADCRILIVGFNASEMRKLVNLVRKGGGSRYMSFSEKLTHIIAGNPSENEIKELRNLAALGVIHVVKSGWLEDCDRENKEVPVLRKHIAYDLLLPKDPIHCSNGAAITTTMKRQGKSYVHPMSSDEQAWRSRDSRCAMPSYENKELENMNDVRTSLGENGVQHQPYASNGKEEFKIPNESSCAVNGRKPSSVFEGRQFCFSASFPADRRAEIVEWVNQGGGVVVKDQNDTNVHFTVECHGMLRSEKAGAATTFVSSHWIKSCLEDGCLLDVGNHILYSPLPCRVPFPAFKSFRLCVSQYDEKERQLLRNLCFTIGAKFVEKLTKKVTHLLCKFTDGPKYEAACKWGIQPVTCEWIYECINQNKIVSADPFYPKEVTSEDREAGACTVSQFPTQAFGMISGDTASQPLQELVNVRTEAFAGRSTAKEEKKYSSRWNKKARLLVVEEPKCSLPCSPKESNAFCGASPPEKNLTGSTNEGSSAVPDVAAAIEDLLEQTSKIHDQKSPSRSECDKELFTSGCNNLAQAHGDHHATLGLSNHWTNRFEKEDETQSHSGDATANVYDHFSETQTDSQVVGYAEDLSGRQMIIDRVRTRSSGLT